MKRLIDHITSVFAFVLVAMVIIMSAPAAQASPGWTEAAPAVDVSMPTGIAAMDRSPSVVSTGVQERPNIHSTFISTLRIDTGTGSQLNKVLIPSVDCALSHTLILASIKRMPDH
jgi:hypothetical protein